jgi:hypothetical protein
VCTAIGATIHRELLSALGGHFPSSLCTSMHMNIEIPFCRSEILHSRCSADVFSQHCVAEPSRICVYNVSQNEWVLRKTLEAECTSVECWVFSRKPLGLSSSKEVYVSDSLWLVFYLTKPPCRACRLSSFQIYCKQWRNSLPTVYSSLCTLKT